MIGTEGLHVDFPRNVILALAPEIANVGAFKSQKLTFDYENSFKSHIEVYQWIFQKLSIFSPDTVILNF